MTYISTNSKPYEGYGGGVKLVNYYNLYKIRALRLKIADLIRTYKGFFKTP